MGTTDELEALMGAQSEDEAEESTVRLKGRTGRKPGRKPVMPGKHPYRKPFTKKDVRASSSKDVAQPWESDPSLLPKLPPNRRHRP